MVATSNIDEIIALAPDTVAYYSIIRQEDVPWHIEQIGRLLQSGINVVTSSNFVTGRWWKAQAFLTRRVERVRRRFMAAGLIRASS